MNTSTKLTNYLSTLVAYPTVSGELAAANECFDYLETFFGEHGLVVQRFESNGFPSLVATSRLTKSPRVLLQAHVDVVPAPSQLFTLKQSKKRLVGRGVYDMKFAAACFMVLAEELTGELADYDFGIMLTSDEEIGGANGVGYLLDNGYSTEVCVLPDGGDDWQLETMAKGVWIAKVKTNGKAAHGSRPWEGDSAINSLIEALQDIRELFGKQDKNSTTLSINQIQGGTAVNQIADQAEATIDMRFVTHDAYEKMQSSIQKIIGQKGLELETIHQIDPITTDLKNPYVKAFLSHGMAINGQTLKKTMSLGASDANFFAARGIPTIISRPLGGGAHSSEEWIDTKSFVDFYKLIKSYVQDQARTKQ